MTNVVGKSVNDLTNEEFTKLVQEATEEAAKRDLEAGIPIVGLDENGQLTKEYPNGTIEYMDINISKMMQIN